MYSATTVEGLRLKSRGRYTNRGNRNQRCSNKKLAYLYFFLFLNNPTLTSPSNDNVGFLYGQFNFLTGKVNFRPIIAWFYPNVAQYFFTKGGIYEFGFLK